MKVSTTILSNQLFWRRLKNLLDALFFIASIAFILVTINFGRSLNQLASSQQELQESLDSLHYANRAVYKSLGGSTKVQAVQKQITQSINELSKEVKEYTITTAVPPDLKNVYGSEIGDFTVIAGGIENKPFAQLAGTQIYVPGFKTSEIGAKVTPNFSLGFNDHELIMDLSLENLSGDTLATLQRGVFNNLANVRTWMGPNIMEVEDLDGNLLFAFYKLTNGKYIYQGYYLADSSIYVVGLGGAKKLPGNASQTEFLNAQKQVFYQGIFVGHERFPLQKAPF